MAVHKSRYDHPYQASGPPPGSHCYYELHLLASKIITLRSQKGPRTKALAAPKHLQLAAKLAYEAGWWAILSRAQEDALAATLVDDGLLRLDGHEAGDPEVVEFLVDQRDA